MKRFRGGTAGEGRVRVAHFIGTLRTGGAENQVMMLTNRLDSSRYDRHVITMIDSDSGFRDELADDVRYYSIRYRRRTALMGMYRLYRYLKKNRIDILHCHMYHAAFRGALAGALASVPVILVSEHGKNTWKNAGHRWLERRVVTPLTACRLAVSEDIKTLRVQADGIPADTIKVLTNAVATDVPVSDNKGAVRRLGAVGRLVNAKDFGTLIEAVRILRDRGYDVSLDIAGEGPERERLQAHISRLDLNSRVRLAGLQPAGQFLDEIDMFVMSSRREGVPVSLLEAMARGLPVVATGVGGIPEVVEDGVHGLLCEPECPQTLADRIGLMMGNESLRMECGRNARAQVETRYGIGNLVKEIDELYMKLLAGEGRPC